ncbi:Co2+/Mg2+ efflux protein ApaG [Pleomorphomonas koreensis]|uniref:Co2+/Mg2+ efflux protein ApaG n=1 Tax=Pleomorphomonas koreensis TaxID=257440 RepID=UPI00040943DB|nr:Co2+/Mg2+ efflux protein ApaG [Pleomorphomonas koreensis]
MFTAVSHDIAVSVEPRYLVEESDPDESRYVWSYRVVIANNGRRAVQLMTRAWEITDANGFRRHVAGPGVVGQQPIIEPGEAFEYTSGCPLSTPSGIMAGSYRMVDDLGTALDVTIPAFSLDIPMAARTLN